VWRGRCERRREAPPRHAASGAAEPGSERRLNWVRASESAGGRRPGHRAGRRRRRGRRRARRAPQAARARRRAAARRRRDAHARLPALRAQHDRPGAGRRERRPRPGAQPGPACLLAGRPQLCKSPGMTPAQRAAAMYAPAPWPAMAGLKRDASGSAGPVWTAQQMSLGMAACYCSHSCAAQPVAGPASAHWYSHKSGGGPQHSGMERLTGCWACGSAPRARSSSAPLCAAPQAVALGAAVQAGILEGSLPGHMVMDIWQVAARRPHARAPVSILRKNSPQYSRPAAGEGLCQPGTHCLAPCRRAACAPAACSLGARSGWGARACFWALYSTLRTMCYARLKGLGSERTVSKACGCIMPWPA